MLSVSCDVAYLLFTTTLWSGLLFLEWSPLNPPSPPSPFPTAFQPMILQTQDAEPLTGCVTLGCYLTSLSLGSLTVQYSLTTLLKLLRGIQEKCGWVNSPEWVSQRGHFNQYYDSARHIRFQDTQLVTVPSDE